jgi:HEPN domain-containing protein
MNNIESGKDLLSIAKRIMERDLEEAWEDKDDNLVVRRAQEVVELTLKGALKFLGVEYPKVHDVGPLIIEHQERFNDISSQEILRLAEISKELRKESELAFYGDIDFIPTEEYTLENAKEAIEGANFVVNIAKRMMQK